MREEVSVINEDRKLSIGFESRHYLIGNDGPKAFMKRLKSSIISLDLAHVRSVMLPFYDIGLFKNSDKSIYKKPYVLRADGIYFDKEEKLGSNEILNRPIYRSMDNACGIVYVSDFSKRLIENFYKKINKPYAIIHNAVDINKFRPDGDHCRQKIGISKDERVIVASAHWRKWKRLEDIVKIFLEFIKEEKDKYRLLILGGDPDYVIKHEQVHYIGEVKPSMLADWYRTGDIYIHLAWLENCGNTQMEAMACGLPVLCTNLGGIGETVKKADGGIVSEADEPFNFSPVNLYDPPRPNHHIIIKDLKKIFNNISMYKNRILFKELSIGQAALAYCGFLSEVFTRIKIETT